MLTTPTLLIHRKKLELNISRMLEKSIRSEVIFRPHFKTHQSAEVGAFFKTKGVDKITVSSVAMAQYFAGHGWDDITIAFPANLRETEATSQLAKKISLNLLVDSTFTTQQLEKLIKSPAGIFIEIDNGYHRSGIEAASTGIIDRIVQLLAQSNHLKFKGFLTHAGNTYMAKGTSEVLQIMNDTLAQLNGLKARYIDDFPRLIISYGDTPSCSMADDLGGFDEIRPGNFVYYDVMQYHIGSCRLNEIAVAVACPVVSVYPEREKIVIYGGSVHLSKEFIAADSGFRLFGYVVNLTKDGWSEPLPGAYVSSVSQEHGIVKMPAGLINNYQPGHLLGILPVHACLTADLLKNNAKLI